MTISATLFLVVVWGVIIAATGHCFWKLMNSNRNFDSTEE